MTRTLVIEHTASPFVVLIHIYPCPPSWRQRCLLVSPMHQHCRHISTISRPPCPHLHFLWVRVPIYPIQQIGSLLSIRLMLAMCISNGYCSTMDDTCWPVVREGSYPQICKGSGGKMSITHGAVVGFGIQFHYILYMLTFFFGTDYREQMMDLLLPIRCDIFRRLKHQHPDELLDG
jgi:hypothetical protein